MSNVPKKIPQPLQCVDREHFKIKWPQAIYNAKWTFTQKQITKQNEKFDLLSTINVSV